MVLGGERDAFVALGLVHASRNGSRVGIGTENYRMIALTNPGIASQAISRRCSATGGGAIAAAPKS